MKKALFLLCFAFLVNLASADEFEKKYGNGVVHIQADSIQKIDFYDAPNGAVIHSLHITRNAWSLDRTMITFDRAIDSLPPWFKTEYFIPDGEYARIDIISLDSTRDFYRTNLRDTANHEIWIRKQKHVTFLSWFQFYNTVANIELKEDELILFDQPDPKSKRINYTSMMSADDRAKMRPLEVNGHWMKVEIQIPQRDPMMSWKTYSGWIQWRDDKQPLITYNLMGC